MTPRSLKDTFEAKGYRTQIAMAAALGVGQGTVSKWLSGAHPIPNPVALAVGSLPLATSGKVRGKVASRRSRKAA